MKKAINKVGKRVCLVITCITVLAIGVMAMIHYQKPEKRELKLTSHIDEHTSLNCHMSVEDKLTLETCYVTFQHGGREPIRLSFKIKKPKE